MDMSAESNVTHRAQALAPGEGETIWFLHNRMTIKATASGTGGAYGLFETWVAPGFSPPLHVHHREDESFWILDGDFTMRCGDETFRGTTGAYFFLPRGVPHTFVNESSSPGHLLTLLTPGGGEAAFVEGGRPAEREGLPPAAPIDVEQLRRIGQKYGHEIVGPPMKPRR
jgi:mannose-6-phosphate isomerase-like protein (cupin superfamily)